MHEIRRAVRNSVRSHYGRRELEVLFGLQPRAAGKLLETLPTAAVGTSRLVEREALANFLERVQGADDVAAVIEEERQQKRAASRKKLRQLIQKDDDTVSLASLPRSLSLDRGHVAVKFNTVEELTEAMYFLARALDRDLEAFTQAYEPVPERVEAPEDTSVAELFRDLQALEQAVASRYVP